MTRFATTNWSLILRAASENDAEARLALALLCEAYWYPVYAYVRRTGVPPADAEDLTQGYFALFLEKGFVKGIDREKGRFRSFLLVSIRNFLSNERDRERAQKRGGGHVLVSLDAVSAEEQLRGLPKDLVTPEVVFERSWAETVLGHVFQRLEDDAARRGSRERFIRLRPFITAQDEPDFAEVAGEWGVKEGAVRVALHRLRRRFREAFREEIGRTVTSPAEVGAEIRHLLGLHGG